ncbi:MAG: pyrroline-5-carboxylate reductase [Clostridia bacterium]|nr:pyrroline-5-carboxylate reductase [Clostridia bacterium]
MEKKFKLGVIGAGFMSTAIVKGAILSSAIGAEEIIVSDLSESALENMAKNGVSVTTNSKMLCDCAEYVLFAVKPQNLDSVLEVIKDCNCKKFISIMAGVKKQKIKNALGDVLVARCMPNTPCSVGLGAVGLDASDYTEQTEVDFIASLLSSFAEVVLVDEDKLNAVTGVSGSSPAYFYLFLKGIIEAGVENGLTYEQAKLLATSTMIGAGEMVFQNKNKSLDELIDSVCSKGGTTIEAIKVYKESGLTEITKNAVDACIKRSKELENL